MGKLFSCVLVAFSLGTPMMATATPTSCQPARRAPAQVPLARVWQEALDELILAASGTQKPWDCSGAEVDLSVADGSAELHVALPDGRRTSRPISAPDLVVPVGEALLARPADGPATPKSAPSTARAAGTGNQGHEVSPDAKITNKPRRGPRFFIDAAVVGRVSAAIDALWSGGSLRVTVPFADWSAAAWARAGVPVKVLDTVAGHFTMSEVCLGLALGYRLLRRPFELRVSGDVSFGVIRMSDGLEHLPPAEATEGSRADFRTGADLQAAWPFARLGRFVVGGDFEVTPARLPGRRTIRPELPEIPGFSAGLSVGLGVAIP